MVPSMKPPLSEQHDRQMRLLIRLLESSRPLSSAEIFESVDGYRERFEAEGGRTQALDKLFERDRKALRATGIEIETVEDPLAPGDRAQWRFRVRQDAAGGASFELTAEDALLINEATQAWLDPAVRDAATIARVKFLGESDSGGIAPASAPRTLVSTPPQFAALRDAVAQRRRIGFEYVKQEAREPEARDVDALHLFVYRGRWLLHAFDHRRGAARNFLLARILGEIETLGEHDREAPSTAELTAQLDALAESQPVRVAVRSAGEADARLRSRAVDAPDPGESTGDWVELELRDWDLGLLADELAASGAAVRVIEPDAMREAVARRLQRVLECHEDRKAEPR
ncbi:Putative DeoR-family transcriptional regulator [Gulosibacter sp. 10]|nr:Putative DeoR-family transcriptional regulator [Gulosibacter sp. 10]